MAGTVPRIAFVRGDASGLDIPGDAEALLQAGTGFLTQAFRHYGAIAPDNAVTRIVGAESGTAGNSGEKLFLTLDYARHEPGLERELFVKFSRYFPDAFRDRRRYELEAEVRIAALSRHPAFPVAVARPCFADFHHDSGTGLLITQRIAFGEGGIEPLLEKNMDHELANPLEHYRATVTALARLAAAHHSGRLSPLADELFPLERAKAESEFPLPFDEAGLLDRIAAYGLFVRQCPDLMPANVATPEFIERLEGEATRFLRQSREVWRFLYSDPRMVALAHWNTHIDNAWFWRNANGVLECGLLDWGMARQMNLAIALWGGLSGANKALLDAHLDDLLALFRDELAAHGGPAIAQEELALHFDLAVAGTGLALTMDCPALVLSRVPEAVHAKGVADPLLRQDQVASGFVNTFAVFLNHWERHEMGASLDRIIAY